MRYLKILYNKRKFKIERCSKGICISYSQQGNFFL